MPAELESMMYTGELPWHRQGVQLDAPATAAEAMVAAGLDWKVQLQPIYTGVDRDVGVKDRYVVCRTDRLDDTDGGQLGIVGSGYTPLQNMAAFSFLDGVVDKDEAVYHTAGALRGGRRVWLLAKLPGHVRVVGDDIVEKYLLLSNSHDGTSAVRVGITPIRVVCMNTLTLALRGMGGLAIRHYPDVADRVHEAARLLGVVNNAYEEVGVAVRQMAATPMVSSRLQEYFEQVLPMPDENDELGRERVQHRHDRWHELFETGDGNRLPGVRGTVWASFNAVTQWVDRESYTKRHKEPLRTIWFGDGARLKQHAFNVAAEMAGVSRN